MGALLTRVVGAWTAALADLSPRGQRAKSRRVAETIPREEEEEVAKSPMCDLQDLRVAVDRWMVEHPTEIDVWVCKRVLSARGFYYRVWFTTPVGCVAMDTLTHCYGPRSLCRWVSAWDSPRWLPTVLADLVAEYADLWSDLRACWEHSTLEKLAANWSQYGVKPARQQEMAWLQAYQKCSGTPVQGKRARLVNC